MNTVTAVRDRILQLCAERGISINRLASLSALPPSSLKNILYGQEPEPENSDDQAALRRSRHHTR